MVRSARSPPGASTRRVHDPGAAKNLNPPSSPSGTSATNSSPLPSSRAYPVATGVPWCTTRPSTTAWLPVAALALTPPPGAPHPSLAVLTGFAPLAVLSGFAPLIGPHPARWSRRPASRLGPRAVVVLDVGQAEQFVQHEPGVRRPLADPAVGDGGPAGIQARLALRERTELVVGTEP